LSPSHDRIAVKSLDGSYKLFDLGGQQIGDILPHDDCEERNRNSEDIGTQDCGIKNIVFSSNGELIAAFSHEDSIWLWDKNGTLISSDLKGQMVAFSPSSKSILTFHRDRGEDDVGDITDIASITLYNSSGSLISKIPADRFTSELVFNSEGDRFIAVDEYHTEAKIFRIDNDSIQTSQILDMTAGAFECCGGIAASPIFLGESIATLGQDGAFKLWEPEGQIVTRTSSDGFLISPDQKYLVILGFKQRGENQNIRIIVNEDQQTLYPVSLENNFPEFDGPREFTEPRLAGSTLESPEEDCPLGNISLDENLIYQCSPNNTRIVIRDDALSLKLESNESSPNPNISIPYSSRTNFGSFRSDDRASQWEGWRYFIEGTEIIGEDDHSNNDAPCILQPNPEECLSDFDNPNEDTSSQREDLIITDEQITTGVYTPPLESEDASSEDTSYDSFLELLQCYDSENQSCPSIPFSSASLWDTNGTFITQLEKDSHRVIYDVDFIQNRDRIVTHGYNSNAGLIIGLWDWDGNHINIIEPTLFMINSVSTSSEIMPNSSIGASKVDQDNLTVGRCLTAPNILDSSYLREAFTYTNVVTVSAFQTVIRF
jgi:hypothetical protein